MIEMFRIGKRDFESIVRSHQAMLYSIAYHFVHNAHLAEEIAQDVFLELYEHMDAIESPAHLIAWLRRTAVNRCIDVTRRHGWRNEMQVHGMEDIPGERSEGDPLLHRRLQRLVASLPEKQRAVVILRYTEDMDPDEIGKILEMPIATVRSHLQRALVLLREKADRILGEDVHGSVRKRSS